MIWTIVIISLAVASARNVRYVDPEYLEALRSSGQDEEFARLLGVDPSLVRPNKEQRSEGSRYNLVSHLGDILLSEEQERQGINHEKYPSYRWPNGRIPYTISTSDFNSDQIKTINDAIDNFNQKVRNLKIVRRRRERDYVHVFSGDGCWSHLGRIGGQQPLSLQANGCVTPGTTQHEFIHAAGFTHEHNRADRDDKLEVLWHNIPERWQSQYQKVNEEDFRNILQYDYYSVMHYPIWAPDNWSKDAFRIPSHIDRNRLGQDEGVSDMDVKKLNDLYS